MRSTLEVARGTRNGLDQVQFGTREWAMWTCGVAINRARRPVGDTRAAAMGSIFSKCSTARRVTTSNLVWMDSARVICISTSVNVRARVISRRKVAFLWLDSIRVRDRAGFQIFRGRPGNPAPVPTSATVRRESKSFTTGDTGETQGNSRLAKKKD